MGSTRFKNLLPFLFFLFLSVSVFPQNPVSVSEEISTLERLSRVQNSQERYLAFMNLARLYQLRGDSEAALNAYESALNVSPNDGQALLELGRLLLSMGEFERAAFAFSALLSGNRDRELLVLGRYYAAKLEALHSGNIRGLAALSNDPEFALYHSSILYALWRISEDRSYVNRLIREFPNSPEANIINFSVELSPTPFWILFPGRTPQIQASLLPPETQSTQAPGGQVFLQTGLFSREANAISAADNLRRAGFDARIIQRQVNNINHWAVGIYAGSDSNADIRRLREAGFESFPVR